MRIVSITLALWMGLCGSALADDMQEAESCVQTKVWEAYREDYGLRTNAAANLPVGGRSSMRLSVYRGRTYRVLTCTDPVPTVVDLIVYDGKGKVVARLDTPGAQPELTWVPPRTGAYFLVAHLRGRAEPGAGTVALAVLHK